MARIYQARTVRSILRDHDRAIRQNASASTFARSGLSATAADQVTMYGDFIVTGDFTAQGKISNDALTNPVLPAQAFQGNGNFGLTVAGANVITISRTVPTGVTSVAINAFGRIAAINSTAAADYLYSAVDVNGTGGRQFGVPVLAGGFSTSSAGYSTLLTGLNAGDTVVTHLYGSTGVGSWASSTDNGADLSVTYLWFR